MLDPNTMTCLPHVVEIDGAPVRLREEKYMRSLRFRVRVGVRVGLRVRVSGAPP